MQDGLRKELDVWAAEGKRARFWWRDDDAIWDTPALRRLFQIARNAGAVMGLAVIPERADHSLVNLVATAPCCVWQHGWGHHSYAYGEFGDGRSLESMRSDALRGQRALDILFGPAGWQRVFVPPFHALSMAFKMLLPSLGYWGLSAGTPLTPPAETVREVNAELDLMDWPGGGKFFGSDAVCAIAAAELVARRAGKIPVESPIGVLTHHLAFDDDALNFLSAFLEFLRSHPAVELLPADQLFQPEKEITVVIGPHP